jgi:hypothetical protein
MKKLKLDDPIYKEFFLLSEEIHQKILSEDP